MNAPIIGGGGGVDGGDFPMIEGLISLPVLQEFPSELSSALDVGMNPPPPLRSCDGRSKRIHPGGNVSNDLSAARYAGGTLLLSPSRPVPIKGE